ncbi:tRNA (guanosine(46)-N7)-methyltransferase TrmB [Akkermansiaceae bacterium]|jgi:tRNA (guanine-N7-)-methyltransferase|nr:tRNA (guanosine(46)-N7)-methyltransferase TrmB [Akkermansiaceae bacterium]MDB4680472.1 tRNA (guanosine(46)-N7)-methyltransferase TrmB [Akkermansiaceae bacterium]MDF1712883.1 tRNA (guanosine(46)-N7)-methyltransferase TrmB [Akkermansiaceae bacterium]
MVPKGKFVRPAEPNELVPKDYFSEIQPRDYFSTDAPLEIDLGCGDGKFTFEMAEHHPDRNFLAVERLLGRVRKVCRGAETRRLDNVRVLRLESLYTLEWLLPESCVDRLHLLCPDPWPKAKHHRRRLFQKPFLDALVRVLKPGGELLFKTDHDEYFEWSEEHLTEYSGLERLEWPDDAFFYPKTDFQLQWEAEGKRLQGLRARKPTS